MIVGTVIHTLLFVGALIAISAVVTWLMIRARIIDEPNRRSSHVRPVPRSGGVAIVVATGLGLAVIVVVGDQFAAIQSQLLGLCGGAVIVAVAGLFDDLKVLNGFRSKLLFQIIACIAALSSGLLIDRVAIPFVGSVPLEGWAYPITMLWLLCLTNIVNFMDGLDGLAGGTAAIVSAVFGILALSEGAASASAISFILCAACIGFLLFNFPRAKIFMGDVGSQFLGFVLAALAVLAAGQETAPVSVLVIPLLFFHFIFDATFTFFRRLLARENVTEAHKAHLYQLLNQIGYSHTWVSILHFWVTAMQGVGAFMLVMSSAENQAFLFLPFLAFQLVYATVVIRLAKNRGVI